MTLTLSGNNILTTSEGHIAGLQVGTGQSVTIQGAGNLSATGGSSGAGIGGGHAISGGNITITSGNIVATGGHQASGIGGGALGEGGNIVINGGTVSATAAYGGAGIGGGGMGAGGNITVNGGTVTASCTNGNGSGIGGGTSGAGGNITINGGTVTATGDYTAAGIGGGSFAAGGIIIIGGTANITATGGSADGAGIGGGFHGEGGIITISDTATVKATSALGLPAIWAITGSSGSIINARLNNAISDTDASYLKYNGNVLVLPASYINFAFNTAAAATVTAYSDSDCNIYINDVVTNLDNAVNIPISTSITDLPTSVTTATAYALTVNLNGGDGGTTNGAYFAYSVVNINAGTKSGYSFNGWETSNNGLFEDETSASTLFLMPENDTTITANWIPVLTGAVSLAINPATGEVTASASGGNTGTTGTLTYTWSGGVTGTGETKTPTPGTSTTCTLTTSGSSGSINATVTVYNVTVTKSGNTGTDDAYIVNAYGNDGDSISIAYTLDSSGTQSNTLTFSGASSNPAAVSTSGNGTASYTIASGDAASGTVTLTATFSHLNIPTYALTIDGGGVGVSGTGSYASGAEVPIDAGTKSGYTFNGWTSSNGGTFSDASSASTTYTMPGNAAIITANWVQITNTVIMSVYKDDSIWAGSGKTFVLKAGSTSYTDLTTIPNGTFEIYDGEADTGVSITVSGVDTSARVDYYTVSLAMGTGIVTVTGDGIYVSGSSISTSATVSSGYTWSKWTQTTGGADVSTAQNYQIANITATQSYTANAMQNNTGSGGGNHGGSGNTGGSTPIPTPTPTPTPSSTLVPIIVDNNNYNIGNVAVKDGTATITIDQAEFDKQLAAAKQSVVVPVNSDESTVVVQLVVKNVQDMNVKGVPLAVQKGKINYNIPASSIDTKAILSALGALDPSLAPVNVIINTDVGQETQAFVNSAVKAAGVEEIVPALQFEITASYNGKTYNIENFDHFVSRSVEVTQEQAQQITTAVVVNSDGTTRHVPTFVYQKDSKWYAQINSLTNSTYALIFNQVSFSDSEGKWYQSVVKEMGSRKIINGVGNNDFAGDKAITRAEFAAIVVRALGLPANGTSAFLDVKPNSWYSSAVATAAQYGIVSGIGNNKFAPDANITREEAMQMIYNASRLTPYVAVTGADKTKSFTDYGIQSVWATPAVNFNINNGFIQGFNGKINPESNITRAETATVVLRLLQKSGLVDVRTKL